MNQFDRTIAGVGTFDVITGTNGPDSLTGTGGDDVISGLDGNDRILGLGGADSIDGGKGNDTVDGGDGDDTIYAGKGQDSVDGGAGDDILHGAGDTVYQTAAGEVMDGGDGDDTIFGAEATDLLNGGLGADTIYTFGGLDTVHGGEGNDLISPGAPASHSTLGGALYGDAGDDVIVAVTPDSITGTGHFPAGTLDGGEGDDRLSVGGSAAGADWLLSGGDGMDMLTGAVRGHDTLDGGAGVDTASYLTVRQSVTADLQAGTATGHAVGIDTLVGIENLVGGHAADSLAGDGGDNQISGKAGADVIAGGAGDDVLSGGGTGDTLTGGEGSDTLGGGGGHDVFLYYGVSDSLAADPDQIVGLGKHDVIDLSAIDADTGADGGQAFTLVAAFTSEAGQLTLAYDGVDRTLLQADVDGDGTADMTIELIGHEEHFTGLVL